MFTPTQQKTTCAPSTSPRLPSHNNTFSTPERNRSKEHELFMYFRQGDLIYGAKDERDSFAAQLKSKLDLKDSEAITIDQINKVFYSLYIIKMLFPALQSMKTLEDYNSVFVKQITNTNIENQLSKQMSGALPKPILLQQPLSIEQAKKFLGFLLTLSKYSPINTGGKSSHKKLSENYHNKEAKIRRACKAGILYAMEKTRQHPDEAPMTIHFLIGKLAQDRVSSKRHQQKEDFAFTGSELRFIFRLYKLAHMSPDEFATRGTEEHKKLQAIITFCEPINRCIKFYGNDHKLQTTFPWEDLSIWDQYKPKVLESTESLLKFYDIFVKKSPMPSVSHTLTSGAGMFTQKQASSVAASSEQKESRKRKQRPK